MKQIQILCKSKRCQLLQLVQEAKHFYVSKYNLHIHINMHIRIILHKHERCQTYYFLILMFLIITQQNSLKL